MDLEGDINMFVRPSIRSFLLLVVVHLWCLCISEKNAPWLTSPKMGTFIIVILWSEQISLCSAKFAPYPWVFKPHHCKQPADRIELKLRSQLLLATLVGSSWMSKYCSGYLWGCLMFNRFCVSRQVQRYGVRPSEWRASYFPTTRVCCKL